MITLLMGLADCHLSDRRAGKLASLSAVGGEKTAGGSESNQKPKQKNEKGVLSLSWQEF